MSLVLEDTPSHLTLSGAFGEGGGQIVRTSTALCALQRRQVRIVDLRAGRNPPGLRAQHVEAVRAVAHLGGCGLAGAKVGSSTLELWPQQDPLPRGAYRFDIQTAGAAPLLLQAIVPLLARASGDGPSEVIITGGTHLPHAPTAGYLRDVYAPAAAVCGLDLSITLRRPGFYPAGGGELVATIGALASAPIPDLSQRTPGAPRVHVRAGVARAPRDIATRLCDRVVRRAQEAGLPCARGECEVVDHRDSRSSGVYLELWADTRPLPCGVAVLGVRGVPAERVADDAVAALVAHLETGAAADPHLADQVLLLLALRGAPARLGTSQVTEHLRTHAALCAALLPIDIDLRGALGEPGEVTLTPRA